MLQAITPGALRSYTLKSDQGESPTVFELTSLDPLVAATVRDQLLRYEVDQKKPDQDARIQINKNELDVTIFRLGIRGWKNFRDDKGQEIQFRTVREGLPKIGLREMLPLDLVSRFRLSWISELAGEILGDSYLTEDEKKNSVEL